MRLIVPQEGEETLGSASSMAVEAVRAQQRKRDSIQSVVSEVMIVALVVVILALIAIIPWGVSHSPIVTYHAPKPEPETVDRPEIEQRVTEEVALELTLR